MRSTLFSIFSLFVSMASSADECACPRIECSPCQKLFFVGSETKQCNNGRKIECEKMVCENVESYFQCLSSAPAIRLPEDLSKRYTEPSYPTERKTDRQFAEIPMVNPVREPSAPAPEPVLDFLPEIAPTPPAPAMRGLASVKKSKVPVAKAPSLSVEKQFGRLGTEGTDNIIGTMTLKSGRTLKAAFKSQYILKFEKLKIQVNAEQGSVLRLSTSDGELVAQSLKGTHSFKFNDSPKLFIVEAGAWRLGKNSGELKLVKTKNEWIVHNLKADIWYRKKDEIIAPTEKFPPDTHFRVSGEDLYAFETTQPTPTSTASYVLHERGRDKKEGREPAEEAICEAPTGQYEQCAWKCFGNGKKDKSCATTSKPQVKCVRFTCSADGEWKMPTFVPGAECMGKGVRTGFCQ